MAPQNIENLLKTDPRVSQVMVVGDRQPYLAALISVTPELRAERDHKALSAMLDEIGRRTSSSPTTNAFASFACSPKTSRKKQGS